MFIRTELLPSILISELQAMGTNSMVLLQEFLPYIAEIFNQQDSTFYLKKYFSARCFILLGEILLCKMLCSTWRNYTLYSWSISNRFYNSTWRTTSLQELPPQGTLESPIYSTRATYSPNSTNKNFLLGGSTRAFYKEKSGQEFYQRKYF